LGKTDNRRVDGVLHKRYKLLKNRPSGRGETAARKEYADDASSTRYTTILEDFVPVKREDFYFQNVQQKA
jgi:hypothetical protein